MPTLTVDQQIIFIILPKAMIELLLTSKEEQVVQNDMPISNEEICFRDHHPDSWYCCINKTKQMRVPKFSIPKGIICDLYDCELSDENLSSFVLQ